MKYHRIFAILMVGVWGSQAMPAFAQGPIVINETPPSSAHVKVDVPALELPPPISPKTSPGPMSLEACIDLGFQHQPALAAARASLRATESGKHAVDRLILPRFIKKELSVRREQACHGVTIANAGLTQAEAETRYAVTRNFFTVQYIRSQAVVIDEVLVDLDQAKKRAKKLFDSGDVNVRITSADLDALDVQIVLVKAKKGQIDNGMLKALAALREAMGLGYDYPLKIAAVELPTAVYAVKTFDLEKILDEKGKDTGKAKQVPKVEYHRLYQLKDRKAELITAAIANRGEMIQANAASRVTELEIQAQMKIFGWTGDTFARSADIHVQPIPQGTFNGEYKPGAFALEYGTQLAGRKKDRVDRAGHLHDRALAVVDKATNLVSLDVEAQFLKWQEAVTDVENLRGIEALARTLPKKARDADPKNFTSQAVIQANIMAIMVRTQLNDEMHMHALALAGLERATAGAFRIFPVPAAPAVTPMK